MALPGAVEVLAPKRWSAEIARGMFPQGGHQVDLRGNHASKKVISWPDLIYNYN